MADLTINTFYNLFKDKSIVNNVLPCLKKKSFRISIFPGYKIIGRTKKIEKAENKSLTLYNKYDIILTQDLG